MSTSISGTITPSYIPSQATSHAPNAADIAFSASHGNAESNMVNNLYGYNPKRYAGKLLRKFYAACVLTHISNTDYEGEIKDMGDTVIIRTTPDIQISDYKKGQNLDYKVYDTDTVELTINRGKYWAFVTNPIDKKQTDIKSFVENWTTDAAKRMSIKIEEEVFRELVISADSHNCGTTAGETGTYDLGSTVAPVVINPANAIAKINDCGTVMAEQNLPVDTEGFWMVIDPKYANYLASSELRLSFAMGDGKSLELKGGQHNLPHLDCFDLYRSTILPLVATRTSAGVATGNAYRYVVFGHKQALTFAAQLTENESLPNPFGFGTLHRGLTVYGFKVVQPKCLGVMVVQYENGGAMVMPLKLSAKSVSLSEEATEVEITASNVATGGTLAAYSTDTDVATVAVSGTKITVTRVGTTAGSCIVFVTDGTTNLSVSVSNAADAE